MKQSIDLSWDDYEGKYRVVKLVNRLEPKVGEYICKDEAQALIDKAKTFRDLTVNVYEERRR